MNGGGSKHRNSFRSRLTQPLLAIWVERQRATRPTPALLRVRPHPRARAPTTQAKKKKIEKLDPGALGVEITDHLQTLSVEEPPKRSAGVKVGSVDELVDKLKNEAKVLD